MHYSYTRLHYIAVDENGKAKCKGRFEFEGLALHKNKSKLIIPKALYAYFVDGTLPEYTLKHNGNIPYWCIDMDFVFPLVRGVVC